ncbi:Cytosine deaminase [Ignavibacterium album JCM 16511]|uniref:tRNA-specific adenosine deaminase n=1 Tax=Ignavibacterium album (strain DSM 19864 / JCM 16511 / NBRC 101810 / Mat9-16) TaxID=945713 RepID=I0AK10_IGNAJ|nr:tRNA adenosine(34) deaminase TadA [Ignavibacterium album]AFH49317.1 Cytosine deaminase [Ignavibacterium album JCM 16511]
MIFSEDKYRFMYAALQEAEKAFEDDEVPIGAVVVYQDKIIGRGYNQVERLKDATAHAEMIAITSASNYVGNWRLNECSIYVTVEPCIMCTGALLNSRINELYFGTYDTKFGACGSVCNLAEEFKVNHKIKVYSGLMASESEKLLKSFFSKKRNKIFPMDGDNLV